MAYRLMNTGKHPLRVDLRAEPPLYLEPGAVSRPLREEQLYNNPYLHDWERGGLVRRLPASMKDILDDEEARAKGPAAAPAAAPAPAPAPVVAEEPPHPVEHHAGPKRKRATPSHASPAAKHPTPAHGGRKTK